MRRGNVTDDAFFFQELQRVESSDREPAEFLTSKSEQEASSPERGNKPVTRSGPQTELLKRTPEKKASAEPSTQNGIEAVRLGALLFRSRLSLDTVSSFFL